MSQLYTVGDYSVNTLTTETTSTPVSYTAVPVINYGTEFAVKSSKEGELVMVSTTGGVAESHEAIRYGFSKINNVYKDRGIQPSLQYAGKEGVQMLVEDKFEVEAVNSKTGESVLLPVAGRMVIQVPKGTLIATDLIQYAIKRVIGAANTATTNVAVLDRFNDLAKGVLNPNA